MSYSQLGDVVECLEEEKETRIFIEVFVGYGKGYDISFEIDKEMFIKGIKEGIKNESSISHITTLLHRNENRDFVYSLRDRCL